MRILIYATSALLVVTWIIAGFTAFVSVATQEYLLTLIAIGAVGLLVKITLSLPIAKRVKILWWK